MRPRTLLGCSTGLLGLLSAADTGWPQAQTLTITASPTSQHLPLPPATKRRNPAPRVLASHLAATAGATSHARPVRRVVGAGEIQVTITVGPADYLRATPAGQVTQARTTSGLQPAPGDRFLLARPDGSTCPATAQEITQALHDRWARPFTVDTWIVVLPDPGRTDRTQPGSPL